MSRVRIQLLACTVLTLSIKNVEAFCLTSRPGLSTARWKKTESPSLGPRTSSALYISTNSYTDRNFYAILQVGRQANSAEIKLAYRRLAKLYHPDSNLNEDTTVQFQELNRAYEVLSDPSLKKMYDMFGEAGIGTSAASDIERQARRGGASSRTSRTNGSPFASGVGRQADSMDPDIYNTYFGGRRAGTGTTTVGSGGGYGGRSGLHQFVGDDVCINFEVDFKTSILGGEAEVYARSLEKCSTCGGKGNNIGEDGEPPLCGFCEGTGITTKVTPTPLGKFQSEQQCTACAGTGNAPGTDCVPCEGKGASEKAKTIKVTIPAGVNNGSKLQVCGEGDAGPNGGPSGDLYIFLKVKEDPIFRREGMDIYAEQTVSCLDAILGNKIRVPVIDGETEIEIPSGTQPGHTICLKGSGAPSLIGNLGERGDHYVTINVEIPKGSSEKEHALVKMLKDQAALLKDPEKSVKSASNKRAEIQEGEAKKIEIDFKSLEELRVKAAEAKTERSLRAEFEELADSRQKEIEELTRRLNQLKTQLIDEREEKLKFEELATQRENKLKAHKRRLDELRTYFDD